MAELEWVLLQNAAVAAALVGEEEAGPLRDRLLAEMAADGSLPARLEQEAARTQAARQLEAGAEARDGAEDLAAALGLTAEADSGGSPVGAAALLEALGQAGLWPEGGLTASLTTPERLALEGRWGDGGQEDPAQTGQAARKRGGNGRGRTRRAVAQGLDAAGELASDLAAALGLPVERVTQAAEAAGWTGEAVASETEWWEPGSGERMAARQAGGGAGSERAVAAKGSSVRRATANSRFAQTGSAGRRGAAEMEEISRFFERDARRYSGE